jgi:hypothetical protein
VEVPQVLFEVFGLPLCRDPVTPRGPCRTRAAVRRPENVFVDQGGHRRQHAIGSAGGLRRHALELGCNGW